MTKGTRVAGLYPDRPGITSKLGHAKHLTGCAGDQLQKSFDKSKNALYNPARNQQILFPDSSMVERLTVNQ